MQSYLAVDIGGTKISAAVFSGHHMLLRQQIETRASEGFERVMERLALLLKKLASESSTTPAAMGIACPGPLSASTGIVLKAPMLGWDHAPVTKVLSDRLGIPAYLECDTNAAALGEYLYGAGSGCGSMAYITVSTGVGAGFVLDGKLFSGAHEGAGEIGHIILEPNGLPCGCGHRGCLEMYASGTAINREVKRICAARGGDPDRMDAKIAAGLARSGDPEYQQVYRNAGTALGRGIAVLLQLMDLERVILGGSVTASFDLMRDAVAETVNQGSYWGADPDRWLKMAALQPDSGLYGAAALAAAKTEQEES